GEDRGKGEPLFRGAHGPVARRLGRTADSTSEVGSGKGPEADAGRFQKWVSNLEGDEDLGQDARMMVPVFYDLGRRKTKVWLFLGWTSKYLRTYFDTPPRIVHLEGPAAPSAATGLLGRLFGKRGQPEIVFTEAYTELACPVTAEVYVEKILDRDEFRRHCDTYKTQSAILANLA